MSLVGSLGRASLEHHTSAQRSNTGCEYACKTIPKRKLMTKEDVEDVRHEIQIMHHLPGHKNVVAVKDVYEDAQAVHILMELCTCGELFDRIQDKGHYSEREAAELIRTVVSIVAMCHSLGVMHRDLKPENRVRAVRPQLLPGRVRAFRPRLLRARGTSMYKSN